MTTGWDGFIKDSLYIEIGRVAIAISFFIDVVPNGPKVSHVILGLNEAAIKMVNIAAPLPRRSDTEMTMNGVPLGLIVIGDIGYVPKPRENQDLLESPPASNLTAGDYDDSGTISNPLKPLMKIKYDFEGHKIDSMSMFLSVLDTMALAASKDKDERATYVAGIGPWSDKGQVRQISSFDPLLCRIPSMSPNTCVIGIFVSRICLTIL